jgi:hypothetical protein
MARILICMLFGVSFLGIVACEGGEKNATFRKVLGGGEGGQQFGTISKGAAEKSEKEACLRVDELGRAFGSAGDDQLVVYTSDAALGRNESGEVDDFSASEELALSQEVLLRGVDSGDLLINRPNLVHIGGSELTRHPTIARYTRGLETLDGECKSLKLKKSESAAGVEHKVIKKDRDTLIVQNSATGDVIKYSWDRADKMKITVTRGTGSKSVCDKELPPLVKQEFTISRQSKQGSFAVSFDLAYMISRFVQNTEAIRDALEDLEKGKPVTLEASVYEAAIDAIQGNRFTREQCK